MTMTGVTRLCRIFVFVGAVMVWGTVFPSVSSAQDDAHPPIVYLTWQRDPTTTMTVQWISEGDASCGERVAYREARTPWLASGPAACTPLHGKPSATVHHVELLDLLPGTTYELRIDGHPGQWKFATLQADSTASIRFVVGGDANIEDPQRLGEVQQAIAARNPDFAVLGGDIAYANGLAMNVNEWLTFLSTWERTMVTPGGVSIPLVVVVGNHEVANGGYTESSDDAPYFYSLFAFPAPRGYGVLDIGSRLSLFLLDSGHSNPIAGAQTAWLAEQLTARAGVTHKIPIYHRPAYPSVRLYQRLKTRLVRKHWTPLFDRHGVRMAFEHHDHAYKRTQPIAGNSVDPMGVTYFGDGGWGGKHARTPAPGGRAGLFSNRRWYLAQTAAVSQYLVVTLQDEMATVQAIDDATERLVDERLIPVHGPQPVADTYHRTHLIRLETWLVLVSIYLIYRRRKQRKMGLATP